jgi:hypothetical protein
MCCFTCSRIHYSTGNLHPCIIHSPAYLHYLYAICTPLCVAHQLDHMSQSHCLLKLFTMFPFSSNLLFFALLVQDFEVIEIVVDVENCFQVPYLFNVYSMFFCFHSLFNKKITFNRLLKIGQAFVGVALDLQSVIIAFRGAHLHRYCEVYSKHSLC